MVLWTLLGTLGFSAVSGLFVSVLIVESVLMVCDHEHVLHFY